MTHVYGKTPFVYTTRGVQAGLDWDAIRNEYELKLKEEKRKYDTGESDVYPLELAFRDLKERRSRNPKLAHLPPPKGKTRVMAERLRKNEATSSKARRIAANSTKLTPRMVEEVDRRYNEGEVFSSIAKAVSLSYNTVARIVKELGYDKAERVGGKKHKRELIHA